MILSYTHYFKKAIPVLEKSSICYNLRNGPIAQWIEQLRPKEKVVGSTPIRAAIFYPILLTSE